MKATPSANNSLRSRVTDHILWSSVGALALLLLWSVVAEYRNGFSVNRIGTAVGLTLLLLSVVGLIFRWGPMLPCTIGGMVMAEIGTSPVASSPMEGVWKDLGVPLIGAVLGAILGLAWETSRLQTTIANSASDGDHNGPNFVE